MHESIFSYNLSRPYPYRWFTWLVFGGGIIAAALFTVINVAADGYNLSNVYSTNPNKTIEDVFWFQRQPWSWAAKVSTTCQPQTITSGSSIQTDNLAFGYTLQNITQRGPNGSRSQQPSFAYQNVGLNCNMTSISLTALNQSTLDWMTSSYYQVDLIPLVITVTAYMSCSLIDDPWGTQFDLSASTNFDSVMNAPEYIPDQSQAQPSLFWGQQLTEFYANLFVNFADGARLDFLFSNTNVNAEFYFGNFANGSLMYNMLFRDGANVTQGELYQGTYAGIPDWLEDTYIANDLLDSGYSPISNSKKQWMDAINGYVKVVSCTVLSDLGQPGQYNMLSSPESGQALFTQARDISVSQYAGNKPPSQDNLAWQEFAALFSQDYSKAADTTDPPLSNSTEFFAWLGQIINGTNISAPAKPSVSTISAQYLCQVPQRKGWGSLLVSVLVADIVFLQVLWKLLCWFTTFMVERENEQAKYCIGCAKNLQTEDYEMLTPATSPVAMPPPAAATDAKTALLGKATSMEASDDESQYVRQRSIPRKPVPKSSPSEP